MTMFVVILCEGCPTKTIVANIARPDVSPDRRLVFVAGLQRFESGQGECELPTRASATSR
jgi:hypothetical protein